MTVTALRSAAKASPVEYELVCPEGHRVQLVDGGLVCGNEICVYPDGDPMIFPMRALVRSGRTRPRQFTSYPTPEVFR